MIKKNKTHLNSVFKHKNQTIVSYRKMAAMHIKSCLNIMDIKNFKHGLKMIITKNHAPVFFMLDKFENNQGKKTYYSFDFINNEVLTKEDG